MSGAKVIVIRHGQTAYNSEENGPERLRGWIDLPLTDEGVQEGVHTAKKLAGQKIHKIYSSDMQRAMNVAALVQEMNKGKTPPIVPHGSLRPWNVGEWAGQPVSEVLAPMLEHMLKKVDIAPPKGEPWSAFLQRYLPFLRAIMEEARENSDKGATVLVTHTRNMRALDGWHKKGMRGTDVDPSVLKTKKHLETGQALELSHDGRKWTRRVSV